MTEFRAFLRDVRGFTLVETVIAFAIVAVALGVLLQAFSFGLRSTGVAEDQTIGLLQAQSLLAGVGLEHPIEKTEEQGEFENGAEWFLKIEPYFPANGSLRGDDATNALLYQVEVRVVPPQGPDIAFTTLRIAPR